MPFKEKYLVVKKSNIPNAGKGLFTNTFIPKGAKIVEYKGKVTTWKEVAHNDGLNPYIYYVNKNHVIDGSGTTANIARYINDGKGCETNDRPLNNCYFENENLKVFVKARKNIEAGEELLIGYGKEYWDTLRINIKLAKKKKTIKRK